MSYNPAAGLPGMLKAGTRHFAADDASDSSVVGRNITACLELSRLLSTSYGPQGRAKLLVNHLQKLIITSDAASIVKELPVEHPAAQLLQQACQKQETECGDQTNWVLAVGGEILWQTAVLIQSMTWQPAPVIISGYQQAWKWLEDDVLPALVCDTIDVSNRESLLRLLHPVLASKHYGTHRQLAPLVADACLAVMKNSNRKSLSVEAVRTVKIPGAAVAESHLLTGFCVKSGVESTVTSLSSSSKTIKIAVFACSFEASTTEAKGTVVMRSAEDLKNYNISEEQKMSDIVSTVVAVGVNVVVVGGNISDMALHFLNQHGVMVLKISSKWELRRLCQAVNATALVRLGAPLPDEMGQCEEVYEKEMGGKPVTLFVNNATDSKIASIVLRASTTSLLNDLERAVDDGVQAVAQASIDGRVVYGGGAVEMACAVALQKRSEQTPGLEQYALAAFGQALTVIPRMLAENAGLDATRVVADLRAVHASHAEGSICDMGVDIELEDETKKSGFTSMEEAAVVDLYATKLSALRLAVDAVSTILKIDQIIMSKPSGGPKPQ